MLEIKVWDKLNVDAAAPFESTTICVAVFTFIVSARAYPKVPEAVVVLKSTGPEFVPGLSPE